MGLRLQTKGTEDKAVAHAMVEMSVGAKQMAGCQLSFTNITDDGLTFFLIVSPAIDNDTVVRLVADYIAVL
jgi:hypothetical protein